MARPNRRGATFTEMIVAAGCLTAAGLCTCLLAAGPAQGRQHSLTIADAERLLKIHEAFTVFADGAKGRFPTPGLVNRLPDEFLGNQPNVGDEDFSVNTTANMFSLMVAQEYFAAQDLVSPIERNPKVTICRQYDMSKYNPASDVYWDSAFVADLAQGSHVSYAHRLISGVMKKELWKKDGRRRTSRWAIAGLRAEHSTPSRSRAARTANGAATSFTTTTQWSL